MLPAVLRVPCRKHHASTADVGPRALCFTLEAGGCVRVAWSGGARPISPLRWGGDGVLLHPVSAIDGRGGAVVLHSDAALSDPAVRRGLVQAPNGCLVLRESFYPTRGPAVPPGGGAHARHVFASRSALRSEATVARGDPGSLPACIVAVEFDDPSHVEGVVRFLSEALRLRG
jgi:hypothetical protein